jgi:hypothetical protein
MSEIKIQDNSKTLRMRAIRAVVQDVRNGIVMVGDLQQAGGHLVETGLAIRWALEDEAVIMIDGALYETKRAIRL